MNLSRDASRLMLMQQLSQAIRGGGTTPTQHMTKDRHMYAGRHSQMQQDEVLIGSLQVAVLRQVVMAAAATAAAAAAI